MKIFHLPDTLSTSWRWAEIAFWRQFWQLKAQLMFQFLFLISFQIILCTCWWWTIQMSRPQLSALNFKKKKSHFCIWKPSDTNSYLSIEILLPFNWWMVNLLLGFPFGWGVGKEDNGCSTLLSRDHTVLQMLFCANFWEPKPLKEDPFPPALISQAVWVLAYDAWPQNVR